MDPRARNLLEFWFGDTVTTPDRTADRMDFWFASGESTPERRRQDALIARRFGGLVELASEGQLDAWAGTARERLALILLLDQFPRNLHRGTALAFAHDAQALSLAHAGFEAGMPRALEPIERVFFLMPLQHAESLPMQDLSVRVFRQLVAEVPAQLRPLYSGFAEYAVVHRDIIARFGRFPYRNAALGRESTAAEHAWLTNDAPDFGQG